MFHSVSPSHITPFHLIHQRISILKQGLICSFFSTKHWESSRKKIASWKDPEGDKSSAGDFHWREKPTSSVRLSTWQEYDNAANPISRWGHEWEQETFKFPLCALWPWWAVGELQGPSAVLSEGLRASQTVCLINSYFNIIWLNWTKSCVLPW